MKLVRSLIVRLAVVFAVAINAPLSAKAPSSAPSKAHIAERIKVLTGLDAFVSITGIERADLSKLNIPFLTPLLRGRQGIKVSFSNGTLRYPHQDFTVTDYEHTFTVYLDETGDYVIAVYARLAEPMPDVPREVPLEMAQEQLRINEVYLGFPKISPKVTFLKALEKSRALRAKEIDAFYVIIRSHILEKSLPVWIVQLRGVPESIVQPGPYWCDVVDARTGEWLQGANLPAWSGSDKSEEAGAKP